MVRPGPSRTAWTCVTLGYTAGYLSIGLEPIRLRIYIVQVPIGRREVIVIETINLIILKVFIN
jgi:hypothetical protein